MAGFLRGKFQATGDLDMAFNRIVNWRNIDDLPAEGGEDGQVVALVDGTAQWTTVAAGGVVIDWDDITGKPATFPPSSHGHIWSEISGVPSLVNSLSASTGIALSDTTGDITITCDLTWSELADKPATFTPTAHTHTADEIYGGTFASSGTAAYVFPDESVRFEGQIEFGTGTVPDVYVFNNTATRGQLRIQNNGTGISAGKDNYLLIDTEESNFGVVLTADSDSYAFASRVFMKNAFGLIDPSGAFLDINISSVTESAELEASTYQLRLSSSSAGTPTDDEYGIHCDGAVSISSSLLVSDDLFADRNLYVTRDIYLNSAAGRNVIGLREKIEVEFDGGGSVLTTGIWHDIVAPTDGTIDRWYLLADQTGSMQVDIWKDTYANYPPTNADSFLTPALVSAVKTTATTNLNITQGDILRFNVDSCATITRGTLTLMIKRR